MSERQTKAGNQITLSHSLPLSLSHFLTLSFTHSQHGEQLLFSCLCSKITLSLSHSHTMLKSHALTLSHSLILSFNHSRHAEQVLFSSLCSKVTVYSRKLQCVFFWQHHPVSSQLKMIELIYLYISYISRFISNLNHWGGEEIDKGCVSIGNTV